MATECVERPAYERFPVDPTPACILLAKGDLRSLRQSVFTGKLRKTPPRWSVPAGVWRILLWPNRYTRRTRRGLGFPDEPIFLNNVRHALLWLCISIRLHGRSPCIWHQSHAFALPKHNGKQDCAALRLLHCLDSLGSHYYRCIWRRSKLGQTSHRYYSCAYAQGRRREQAICTRALCAHRLSRAGISYVQDSFDATNAFASIYKGMLCAYFTGQCDGYFERDLLLQRTNQARMALECSDGVLHLDIGSGTLPGDSFSCEAFQCLYHLACDGFLAEDAQPINVQLPWLRRAYSDDPSARQDLMQWSVAPINIGFSGYADDLSKIRVVQSSAQLLRSAQVQSRVLSWHLGNVGVQCNDSKRASMVHFAGKHAQRNLRAIHTMDSSHGFVHVSRYLGPILQSNGGMYHEQENRCRRAKQAYGALGTFWRSPFMRWKSIVFGGMFDGTLISGLTAFFVPKSVLRKLDSTQATFLRKVMCGQACDKDRGPHPVSLSNDQVLRKCQLHSASTQLAMQRLKWWQCIVRHPERHIQLLGAFFGVASWERRNSYDEDGRVTLEAKLEHSWSVQLRDDLVTIFTLLFTDFHIRDSFLRIDPKVLGAARMSVAIPPPGLESAETHDFVPPHLPHICNIPDEDSHICGACFSTVQGLAMHQFRHHGLRGLASALTVSNACILCGNFYASKQYAARHLQKALEVGICPDTEGSCIVFEHIYAPPFSCAVCDLHFNTYIEAQVHLCEHLDTANLYVRL